jgi:signal transduction histidine kinase
VAEPATDELATGPVRHRIGVRGRLTLTATVLVALVLAVGSALLMLALHRALIGSLDASARQRAADVATLIDTGNLPRSIPASGGTVLVQVIDARGRVLAATPGGDALVPLLSGQTLRDVRRGGTAVIGGERIGVSDSLRVVATTTGGGTHRRTVLVAVSGSEAGRTLHLALVVLLVGVPALVGGFALACWFLVGAALQPVSALRRGAAAIREAGSGARLPVPPTRDEVAHLAATLNDMLDRLAAGSARQRDFVADAAHELRSPLASIRTQLEVARAHPEIAEWEETADGVLVDVVRLSRLADALLLLARLDDDAPSRHGQERTDLGAVAATVACRPGRRLPVRVDLGERAVVVAAGEDAIASVLDNLIGNADRHAATTVRVSVRADPDAGVVEVVDDGPGIPAAQRDRVFERFARLDGARASDSGGSGLGLAIVARLVRSCAGTVRLLDAGPGLRAEVRLPLAPEDVPAGVAGG